MLCDFWNQLSSDRGHRKFEDRVKVERQWGDLRRSSRRCGRRRDCTLEMTLRHQLPRGFRCPGVLRRMPQDQRPVMLEVERDLGVVNGFQEKGGWPCRLSGLDNVDAAEEASLFGRFLYHGSRR